MKKVLLCLCVLTILGLQASDDIGANMKGMRDGLVEIQDGFLYNQKDSILSGIKKIEKLNDELHSKKTVLALLPKDKKRFLNIALISAKSLASNLQEMREYIEQNHYTEASSTNAIIIRNCTRCHSVVRGW